MLLSLIFFSGIKIIFKKKETLKAGCSLKLLSFFYSFFQFQGLALHNNIPYMHTLKMALKCKKFISDVFK